MFGIHKVCSKSYLETMFSFSNKLKSSFYFSASQMTKNDPIWKKFASIAPKDPNDGASILAKRLDKFYTRSPQLLRDLTSHEKDRLESSEVQKCKKWGTTRQIYIPLGEYFVISYFGKETLLLSPGEYRISGDGLDEGHDIIELGYRNTNYQLNVFKKDHNCFITWGISNVKKFILGGRQEKFFEDLKNELTKDFDELATNKSPLLTKFLIDGYDHDVHVFFREKYKNQYLESHGIEVVNMSFYRKEKETYLKV